MNCTVQNTGDGVVVSYVGTFRDAGVTVGKDEKGKAIREYENSFQIAADVLWPGILEPDGSDQVLSVWRQFGIHATVQHILNHRPLWRKNIESIKGHGIDNPLKMKFNPLTHSIGTGKRPQDPLTKAKNAIANLSESERADIMGQLADMAANPE